MNGGHAAAKKMDAEREKALDGPAHPMPPGELPLFDNPPNSNREAHAGIAICLAFFVIAVIVRFCSRIFYVKRIKIEDGKYHSRAWMPE